MTARRAPQRPAWRQAPDGRAEHRDWLSLVDVTGPFLSLPVLLETWPTLDALDADTRERLREAHGEWLTDPSAFTSAWVAFVLRDLLEWGEDLCTDPERMEALSIAVREQDVTVAPSFALRDPAAGEETTGGWRLIGFEYETDVPPTTRLPGSGWAASPCDRVALLCRGHDVPLGLATNGRWWGLVWAPRGGATATAVFDATTWPEVSDRNVVRAFRSLLDRRRFFAVPEQERLPALFERSVEGQEDLTEALGVQVRRA
ncbi:MAG: hypothetical protein J2P44_02950, partial [Candidatus Dormibacteraeota bacterium]|nr:hypothetical protein [Candidatus Dormibacteraeota bacterium]